MPTGREEQVYTPLPAVYNPLVIVVFGGTGLELQKILCVGLGGFAGATLRYLVSLAASGLFGTRLPWGTLIVNALGGLFAGFIMELSIATDLIPAAMRLFVVTGVLGGLTTFSTFSWETIGFFGDGDYLRACLNIGLNLALSLGGVVLGRWAAGALT